MWAIIGIVSIAVNGPAANAAKTAVKPPSNRLKIVKEKIADVCLAAIRTA